MTDGEQVMVLRFGSLEIDVPESLGFFGGIWAAVALGLIEPPLGVFIAAVPFLKMLDVPRLPLPANFLGHVIQGAAKPVGSDVTARSVSAAMTRETGNAGSEKAPM